MKAGPPFPTPWLKLFIGVEHSAPLGNLSIRKVDYLGDPAGSLKSHAPNLQVGVCGAVTVWTE